MPWHVLDRLYAVATKSAREQFSTFFDDLVRCETRLYNAIGERLRVEHGIVTTQFEFLRYFRDNPASRVADAATNFAAGIGAISKGVDRLETRGWVRRNPNPADARSSLVSLTASGAALVADAEVTYLDALDELLSPTVDGEQLEAGGAVLSALRGHLERGRIGLPVG
jgi:MarR family multiple antibiotic resistance transcriptional regulator